MAYSTSDDPRMDQVQTWDPDGSANEKRRKDAEAVVRAKKERTKKRLKEIKKRVRLRWVKNLRSKEEILQRLEAFRKGMAKAKQQRKINNKQKKKASYTKGSLRFRHGAMDVDALRSDRFDRLVLDSRCMPYGEGRYEEGKKGEPGKFISDETPQSKHHRPRREFNPKTKKWEKTWDVIPDTGPVCFGGKYVRFGRGRPPGTDIRKYSQIPRGDEGKGPGVDSIWKRSNTIDSNYIEDVTRNIIDWNAVYPRFKHDGEHRD